MQLSWKIDANSLRKIQAELNQVAPKIQRKVIRKGLKNWAQNTQQVVKSNISHDDPELRKSIKTKIKILRKGRGVWAAVGVQGGKAVGLSADGRMKWIATRGRWYEDGWTPYPKGKPTNRKGKDWRKGLRGQGGGKIYQTKFIERSYNATINSVPQYIIDSINEFIRTGQ